MERLCCVYGNRYAVFRREVQICQLAFRQGVPIAFGPKFEICGAIQILEVQIRESAIALEA